MATHSSILAWRSPWVAEPGRLQSMGHKESGTPVRPPHTQTFTEQGESTAGCIADNHPPETW